MASKNVLITGSTGRVASYLIEPLVKNNYIVWLPRRDILDLTDADNVAAFFAEHGYFDVIIHAASAGCQDVTDPDMEIFNTNIRMIENLITNANSWGQLINFGSGADMDTTRSIDRFTENEYYESMPKFPYGKSKRYITERLRILDASEKGAKRITNVRIFGVIDSKQRIFQRLLECHETGTPINIFEDREFDFFSLDDLATLLIHLIEADQVPVDINAVYAEKYLISDVAKIYSQYHPVDIVIDSTGGLNYTGDGTVLQQLNLPLKGLVESVRTL